MLFSTFAADGSEYSSKDGDSDDDDDSSNSMFGNNEDEGDDNDDDDMANAPTVELSPVPMSKNAGNRFVSFVWDRLLEPETDTLELFYQRIELTEDHVMYCRKANLYNETFNTQSMVDVLWSLPMYVQTIQAYSSIYMFPLWTLANRGSLRGLNDALPLTHCLLSNLLCPFVCLACVENPLNTLAFWHFVSFVPFTILTKDCLRI